MSEPGWYPDPEGGQQLRWFDGEWTAHVRPALVASLVPAALQDSPAVPEPVPSPPEPAAGTSALSAAWLGPTVGPPSSAPPAPSAASSENTEARTAAIKDVLTGLVMIAAGVAVAMITAWATSKAAEAAGGGGGVRVWSVPLFVFGLAKIGIGLHSLSKLSAAPFGSVDIRLPGSPAALRAAAVDLLRSNAAPVIDDEAAVTGYVATGTRHDDFTLMFEPDGRVHGSGVGRGLAAIRWVVGRLASSAAGADT